MTRHIDQSTSSPAEIGDVMSPAAVSRRRLLVGGAVATALAAVTAACGNNDAQTPNSSAPTTSAAGVPEGDLAVATLAAGLEVLAVGTYKAGLEAATAGKLGDVPPAVAEYAKTAMAHHEEHLKVWNGVLSGAGKPEVTEPNADLKTVVDAEFAKVKDVGGLANLALMLEKIAADTYLKAMPTLKSEAAIRSAAGMQVVDQQHQSILLYALGQYPVPEVFQSTGKA
ncbi:MAG TPA: ferritin-like domain-containing protein, partial [Cryptosporangiaceae bacterium]|nr:ferritin-like domain-containing protein [Cryptosporangiaceae bacterium]